ncbi:MAG: thiolase family protein [Planctomycetota bacterium]|jgi:acetyl-CoA acetyltransferase family protein|nr:thiolase family protein [Planctomycetota bacterium]
MEAYILDAVRTPMGRRDGSFANVRSDDLGATCLKAIVDRNPIEAGDIEDVVMGCVTQTGEQGFDVARMSVLAAGFPISVPGTTVNRLCGSGQQAITFAAQGIASGMHDLIIGSGTESMSRVPMGSDGGPLNENILDRFELIPQGLSAELIAQKWELDRESLDRLGLESHHRASQATDADYFQREIVPVPINGHSLSADETFRRGTSIEKMGSLKPAFKEDGLITAGNSSQISDGASAMLLASKKKVEELGVKPRARIVATALSGVDPTLMLTGPIPATRKVLEKTKLTLDDIDLFEVNEAFASVVLAWQKETGVPFDKINVNGGAIALGHPLGASGCRLLTTLLCELERRDARYGLSTLCIGLGMGIATIIERL